MSNKLPRSVYIKTRSNYEKLNGIPLAVQEIAGTRVSVEIFKDDIGKYCIVDFNIKEVVAFSNDIPKWDLRVNRDKIEPSI